MPAVSSQDWYLDDMLAMLPQLTMHLVDLPDRLWVADPATLTCWVHKGGEGVERLGWCKAAMEAIASARPDIVSVAEPPPRALQAVR